jgi:hypothetical protein
MAALAVSHWLERQTGCSIKETREDPAPLPSRPATTSSTPAHPSTTTPEPPSAPEIAGRPLRLNELTDLARILKVRTSHLAATETDFSMEMVQNDIVAHSGHAARLKADIDELNQMLAEKTQAYENVLKLLQESREEYGRLIGQLG